MSTSPVAVSEIEQETSTTPTLWEQQLQRQRELEESCMAEGARRFKARVLAATQHGVATREGAARSLLSHAIEPIEKGIEEMFALSAKTRGTRHVAVKWINLVGVDVAAYMTAKVILDGIGARQSFGKCALTIAQLILDELRWRRFQEQEPELFEYRQRKFTTSSYAHMARSLSASMKYAEVDTSDLDMPPSQRMLLGAKLIEIAQVTTGLFEVISQKVPGTSKRARVKTEMFLAPTQATVEWVATRNGKLEALMPVAMPMVAPPLAWGPGQRGGYRFALRGKYPLVRGITSSHAKELAASEMPQVYDAVNHLQNTAWRINTKVLAVVEALMAGRGGVAGLPSTVEVEMPLKPQDIATNKDAKRAWKFAAGKAKNKNYMRKVAALGTEKVLNVAREMQGEDAFYYPYNLDFRGRVYPMANYLTPQGDDLCKGLLTFAQGKPLGTDGAVWLALHGANVMGKTPEGVKVSKLTRQQRVDWVVANTLAIAECAADPVENQWWTKAKEPMQFLAFCFEWAGYVRQRQLDGTGESYVCALPVAMDGTCNGLQHFSAMFRDSIGGASVNLVPSETPNDIYSDVADYVTEQLQALVDDEKCGKLAQLWLDSGLVNRDLAKRPTMTFGYGSKKFGFVFQLKDYLRGLENWDDIKALFHDAAEDKSVIGPACRLMASLIWDALGEKVVAAFDGMAWMQKAAGCVVATGNAVKWVVPSTGFRVRQEYFASNRKQVKTMLAGRVIQPSVYEPTNDIIPHKQRNAIAPNVIHSLDAAALMLTVNHAAAQGVEAFGMVHDSYATVPGDAAVLAQATRQQFVSLYSQDIAADLKAQWTAQSAPDCEMPEPPAKGSLDLGMVLVSDYFFA